MMTLPERRRRRTSSVRILLDVRYWTSVLVGSFLGSLLIANVRDATTTVVLTTTTAAAGDVRVALQENSIPPIQTSRELDMVSKDDTVPSLPQSSSTESSSSSDDTYLLQCLKQVLHHELPIARNNRKTKQKCPDCDVVWAHHYDAIHLELWEAAASFRLEPFSNLPFMNCSIWEVGAHVRADDSRVLLRKTQKNCHFHAFEPLDFYSKQLLQFWSTPQAGRRRMHIHEYGIAMTASSFVVSTEALKGQATFLGGEQQQASGNNTTTTDNSMTVAHIQSFDYAIQDAKGIIPTVLHINCEGCEYDLLRQAKRHGFLNSVKVIQIGWHNYGYEDRVTGSLGPRTYELCEIRQMLSETHTMINGLAFGWDRWELKD